MRLLESVPAIIGLVWMILLHGGAVFLKKPLDQVASFINIVSHIAYLFILLDATFPIEEAVLLYMISVFFYTVFSAVRHRFFSGAGDPDLGAPAAGSDFAADGGPADNAAGKEDPV